MLLRLLFIDNGLKPVNNAFGIYGVPITPSATMVNGVPNYPPAKGVHEVKESGPVIPVVFHNSITLSPSSSTTNVKSVNSKPLWFALSLSAVIVHDAACPLQYTISKTTTIPTMRVITAFFIINLSPHIVLNYSNLLYSHLSTLTGALTRCPNCTNQ